MAHASGSSRGKAKTKQAKGGSATRRAFGIFGRFVLTVFLVLVLTCTIVGGALAFYVINFVTPQNVDISRASLDANTFIYATDSTGKTDTLAEISGDQKRVWTSLGNIPEQLQYAFICTEDQRFYEHNGVDWKRTFLSFANLFVHYYSSQQGGSTITQQLVNVRENMGKNKNDYARKIQEIVDALQLERGESKQAILEAYLNTINFDGYYGVETASENFFGKDVKQLDLAQCAALACMPKAPSTYDPRMHPAANASRRKTILGNMLKQGKITQAQYDKAIAEKVTAIPKKANAVNGWFTDMVIQDVQADLVKKYGWEQAVALDKIYSGGYSIYTTEDPSVQSSMDAVYSGKGNTDQNNWIPYPASYGQPQSAMMIVDYSGQIKGVEGARGAKTGNLVLDRATGSKRQPGSSLKPLGVYAPAIDLNKITWSTAVPLSKITLHDGTQWPMNDGDDDYTGNMLVADALAQSVNTAAVHIDQDYLSPKYTLDFLMNKLGFTSLDKTDNVPAIAIGGAGGVTVREMAGGYEIFGNNGLFIKPYSYTKVVDSQGNVLLQNNPVATKAIEPDTAYVMNQLLIQNVTRLDGTGHSAQIPGVLVGGKTGTTNEHKDRWFCGITPDYVGVVWVGYDTPKNILYYTNEMNPALKAWRAVMSAVDKNPKKSSFPYNGNVVKLNYDPKTGYISSSGIGVGYYRVTDIAPQTPVGAAS